MTRTTLALLGVGLFLVSCLVPPRVYLHSPRPRIPPPVMYVAPPPIVVAAPPPVEVAPAMAPHEDAHWFQPDDYLIRGASQCGTTIGKLIQPASPATKGEAQFFSTVKGTEVWSKSFWPTRPATPADLQLGALVFCAPDHRLLPSKQVARTHGWAPGRIVDTSDLYKGAISFKSDTGCCCGEVYSCPVGALRVPL